MQIFRYLLIFVCISLFHISYAPADEVEASLILEKTIIQPGETLFVAVKLRMKNGWHTYWKNPGDAGYATQIEWALPPKTMVSDILWPAPEKFQFGDLVNFGYSDEVTLLTKIQIPKSHKSQIFQINAMVEWLACKDVCIPGNQKLSGNVAIGTQSVVNNVSLKEITSAKSLIPGKLNMEDNGSEIWLSPSSLNIKIPQSVASNLESLYFFPTKNNIINYSSQQILTEEGNFWNLKIKRTKQGAPHGAGVEGIIVAKPSFSDGHQSKQISLANPKIKDTNYLGMGNKNSTSPITLLTALLFSLIGGFLLNLMPCVLPVISIKALNLIEGAQHGKNISIRTQGIIFSLGILTSFWIVFFIMTLFISSGLELGWGYQLQSPLVIASLALLFSALGLNLLDVYIFGSSIQGMATSVNIKLKYLENFLSGVLATVVATPCTAPFMGAALGFSVTQSSLIGFVVFSGIAIGMASPYLALSIQPKLIKLLPKPGKWMQTLRQSLSFPLFFTVAWLVWVLGKQVGVDGVFTILAGILLLAIGLFSYGKGQISGSPGIKKLLYGVAFLFIVAALTISWPRNINNKQLTVSTQPQWESWEPEKIRLTRDRPIFVDFTAAWCLTCQFNKKTVLENVQVIDYFTKNNFLLLRADWTNHNPQITEALKNLGRQGIPLYVIYPINGKSPVILPEILTKKLLLTFIQENSS